MKNILVLARDDQGGEARWQCALDITRAMEGHLTVVAVTRVPVPVADYVSTVGDMIALVDEQERERRNTARMKPRLEREDVTWDWIDVTGSIADCMIAQAAFADLAVLSTPGAIDEFPDARTIVSDVVMEAGCPVLAVPPVVTRLALNETVLCAYDGSRPAIATLRRAIPLLQLASKVILFNVDEAGEEHRAEDAARYLARYGVHAMIERATGGLTPPDVLIRTACRDHRASYCVMGAYGRSRRLQNIFGGVTRRMLAHSEIPLLLGN